MSVSFRSVVHAVISRLALAAIALSVVIANAEPVSADVRRPPVREIDVLLALIEADVPTAAWPAVDDAVTAYRARVMEREAQWAAQPSLDRLLERPAEIDSRRREQQRRAREVQREERRLIDALRAALLEAIGSAGSAGGVDRVVAGDPATVEGFAYWLQARVASRTMVELGGGVRPPVRLPEVALLQVDPDARRAIAAAMKPKLAAFVRGVEAALEASLESAPGRPPRDPEGRGLPEFQRLRDENLAARESAGGDLLRASTALRHAALASVPDAQRLVLERALQAQLQSNFHITRDSTLLRRTAPRLSGLDEAERLALEEAAARVDEFLAANRRQVIDRADQASYGLLNIDDEPFFKAFPEINRQWRTIAEMVLGDRLDVLARAVLTTAPDRDGLLSDLFGDEVAATIRADPDPTWQLRQLARPTPQTGARWRSLADASPVSAALRDALRAGAADDAVAKARIESALKQHDAAWIETISPLQARCRANVEGLPRNLEKRVDTARILGDLATLRHAIQTLEVEFVAAIADVSDDPVALAAWRLARATELLAPTDHHERMLWSPLLPSPQSINEVVERAGVTGHVAELAQAIAYGLAIGDAARTRADADPLVPALRERHDQLERIRIVMTIRTSAMQERMGIGGPTGLDTETFNARIKALLAALDVNVGRADLAVVDAWEAILADWDVALEDDAAALRRAWLRGLFPELEWQPVPADLVVERLAASLGGDDPRRPLLDAIAAGHRAVRDELVIATSSTLARLPRSVEWILVTYADHTDPRQTIGQAFRTEEADHAARTLRQAIAVVGVDVALATPAVPAALMRLESGWLF